MFHTIWEFVQSANRVVQSEDLQIAQRSLRNLRICTPFQPCQRSSLLHYDSHKANINKLQGTKSTKSVYQQGSIIKKVITLQQSSANTVRTYKDSLLFHTALGMASYFV